MGNRVKSGSSIFFLFALTLVLLQKSVFSQTTFYDINIIQKIELFFSQSNWDYQLDTAKLGIGDYIVADSVKINGTKFDFPGVKYKGNSSYDSTYSKNPLHIELDNILNQSYEGITDIKLGNCYADPSMIREVLAYDILKNYMHCPRANFAELYINGNYIGLYSNAEHIGKDFCSNHFFSSSNTFFKCNPIVTPTPLTKSNLKFITNDSSNYFNYYELKSNYGWKELTELCDTITNFNARIPNIIDLDRVLWMLAFNNLLVNLDSYNGVFAQNYYLYKDHTNHFNPIVWDLNMSFGGFPFVGSGASSMGSLTIANMQQLSATFHSTDPFWPLIKNTLNNPTFKRMYFAHMRTILNEMFGSNLYQSKASQYQSLIDASVQSDINKFFSYTQFQNGMTGNTTFGSYTIPGIANLMSARLSYLQSTSDFTATSPTISNVISDNTSPSLNSIVNITAQVSNASSVELGYRNILIDKFIRTPMFDDGNHNDGIAGDNIYGASFSMITAQAQYYIYAENTSAGKFSPERAEHEFYTLYSSVPTALPGQVKINEFLAVNQSLQQNEFGSKEDWMELYNNTNSPLELFGLYLTDDLTNLTKYSFPPNCVIQPNNYLIIWADEKPTTSTSIHCNFKLSSAGEKIILSNAQGTIIDSVSFGPQRADISMGRCQNGTGNFTTFINPTFGTQNCFVGLEENNSNNKFEISPNPSSNYIFIDALDDNLIDNIELYNVAGELIHYQNILSSNKIKLNIGQFDNGLYFVRINQRYLSKLIISH